MGPIARFALRASGAGRAARVALMGVGLVLLAGCAEEARYDTVQPVAANAVAGPGIGWQTRLAGDAVQVTITDPRRYWRVDGVELVTPGGGAIAAEEITRETYRDDDLYGYGGTSVGIGGGWGSRSGGGVGIGVGVPLFGGGSAAASRVLARIRLPDPAAYRQTAAAWKIRVRLTDPNGQPSHAEIPAPIPQG